MSKQSIEIQYFSTMMGELIIGTFQHKLCLVDYRYRKARKAVDARLKKTLKTHFLEVDNSLISETKKQLNQYFKKERKVFTLPLILVGSPFQKQVWTALQNIPFGQTISYLTLAKNIHNKKAFRAVANANGANAISIIVPCHRVINSNGALGGYAGGLATKAQLIQLEQE